MLVDTKHFDFGWISASHDGTYTIYSVSRDTIDELRDILTEAAKDAISKDSDPDEAYRLLCLVKKIKEETERADKEETK